MLSLAGVRFAETKGLGRLCQSSVAWDVTWKGRQKKALVCLLNRRHSFYRGWFWACIKRGTESKDRLFFHELSNPRHSQWCPAEREYLQWCNLTDVAILVYTLCQVMSTFSIAQICSQNESFESMWHFPSLTQELPSMNPLKFKHPENSELRLPIFAKLMCKFTIAWIWKSQYLKNKEKNKWIASSTFEFQKSKVGTIFICLLFSQPLPYLGNTLSAILYHDQDQQYDPLVDDKVLMKFQSMTHPKYWKI